MSDPSADQTAELMQRIAALTAERARIAGEVEVVRVAVAERRAERDERVKDKAARRRRRRALLACAVFVPLIGCLVAYIVETGVERETLRGQVAEVTGPAPAIAAEPCRLTVEPAYFPFNTQMQLDCGTRRLYGHDSYGQIDCQTQGGRITQCEDGGPIASDGDPHLVLDRAEGLLLLDDGQRWTIRIALER